MSFSTTTDRVTLSGNGATTGFSFPYILFATADLKVYLKNNTTGAETLQTITTHYTISGTLTNGVYESGVTVTFLTAPTASQTVLMLRDRDVTQELDLDENGKIPSTSLEKQLDKFATYIQRVKNKLVRSVGLPEGYTASFDPTLPPVMVNDGYLKTTSTGSGVEYIAQADLINTISTGAQAFTASRAIVSDSNGLATVSATTAAEVLHVNGVTSQLSGNSQAATLSNKAIDADTNTITNIKNADIKAAAAIDATKIADGSVTSTEFQYINTLSSNAQTQLDAKLAASFGIVNNVLSWTDRGSDPSSPSSGFKNMYSKAIGMFYKDSAGNVYQFANLEETQTFTGAKTFTGTVVLPKVQYFASATGDPASVSAGNPVIFPTELADPYSAYNNSTGRFTVPTGGADYYEINMSCSVSVTANGSLYWYKNAVQQNLIGAFDTGGTFTSVTVITSLLADGDIIDLRPNNTINPTDGCITFKRIGGYR